MDIRFLLVFLLPAFATAGSYADVPETFGADDEGGNFEIGAGEKASGETGLSGSLSAELLNDVKASSATEDYRAKAKTLDENARWYRNLLNEKQVILAQVKKRLHFLRAMTEEALRSAEEHRRAAAEKNQISKALEAKALEAKSLNKEHTVLLNELRVKMNNELKQRLDSLISSRVAETNAQFDMAEVERQKAWAEYWDKLAQDILREGDRWERSATDSLETAKKLKSKASEESAEGKEMEKQIKETQGDAAAAEIKARKFSMISMEFSLKSHAENHKEVLVEIKKKGHETLATSMLQSSINLHMFSSLINKDRISWEKKTESVKAEAKLLEASTSKMAQHIEKLKASMNTSSQMPKKRRELGLQEEKVVKPEPKAEEVSDKKM